GGGREPVGLQTGADDDEVEGAHDLLGRGLVAGRATCVRAGGAAVGVRRASVLRAGRAVRVRAARPGARQLLGPFSDRRPGLFGPVLLTEAIAQRIAEADAWVPGLVPPVGPRPCVPLIITLTCFTGVGSSAGPGSLPGVGVLSIGAGVGVVIIGAGRCRRSASAQPDLIAHDVDSDDLGAPSAPAAVRAHTGRVLRG